MAKKIIYGKRARRIVVVGMTIVVKVVGITIGPRGKNVVMGNKKGSPQIINDGVTVAKKVKIKNKALNTGIRLIKQAALKTNTIAGDGTTTATVLAYAIIKGGMRNLIAGTNPIELKTGIEKATAFVIKEINEYALAIQDSTVVSRVASISAGNDDTVGEMIAHGLESVGKDGVISFEDSKNQKSQLKIREGMTFYQGFISPYFINIPEEMQVCFQNPYVLITDKSINIVRQELVPILEQITPTKIPLVIIAQDIGQEALSTLILNKVKRIVEVAAIRAPAFGQLRKSMLQDIAVLTNTSVFSEEMGLLLKNITIANFGRAEKITITKTRTTIVNKQTENNVKNYCNTLRKQISLTNVPFEKKELENRIAALSGSQAIIQVGATTEAEKKEKKLRIEDAINATKAAFQEGVVPGGGTTYVKLGFKIGKWSNKNLIGGELIGATIIMRALEAPLRKIVHNLGTNGSHMIVKMNNPKKPFDYGYDALKQNYGNLYETGLLDPAKVTRTALQNATSIATMILITECLIIKQKK